MKSEIRLDATCNARRFTNEANGLTFLMSLWSRLSVTSEMIDPILLRSEIWLLFALTVLSLFNPTSLSFLTWLLGMFNRL